MTKETSNLADLWNTDTSTFESEKKQDDRSELAKLVDRQLEARGAANYNFDEKEVTRTRDRELLGPKFYYDVLQECGLDFWKVFNYAAHYAYYEREEEKDYKKIKHPSGVEELFAILTGKKDFEMAVRLFIAEVYPTHPKKGMWEIFREWRNEVRRECPIQSIQEYFIFELTDEKLKKLEIVLENANAMKEERFKLLDQFAERQDGNMEKIHRLLSCMGDGTKAMIFPLLLNELRVNPSDVFRYFYHRDLWHSMQSLPLFKSENFDTFLKITGVVSYDKIFEEDRSVKSSTMSIYRDAVRRDIFWKELEESMKAFMPESCSRGYDGTLLWRGLDTGYDGIDVWGNYVVNKNATMTRENFYRGCFVEEPMYLISSYGAEATKDRLDAIFTPEVLEIIYRDYKQFTFESEKRNVEKAMKQLRAANGATEEKPAKKGLFGLFRK